MKLYIHFNDTAVEDYNYWFKTGEYWRLPMKVSGDLKLSCDEKTYIHRGLDYQHLVNAKLIKKVIKPIVSKNYSNNETSTTTYGLLYFEIELQSRRLNFFMESGSYSEYWDEFETYEEGQFYTGAIQFYLVCGTIDSIVLRLWDDFEIPSFGSRWSRNPYALLRIEELFWENGPEAYDIKDLFAMEHSECTMIAGCDFMGQDEYSGKILSYYALKPDRKIEFKNIGTLKFALIDLYLDVEPEYFALIDGSVVRLTHIIGDESIKKAYEKLSEGEFMYNSDYRCEWTLEEVSIKFYDGKKIDITSWNESEPYDRTIIVQYTYPDFGEVLTTTNLDELKEFVEWNDATIARHKQLLDEAKSLGYKFDWDLGQKRSNENILGKSDIGGDAQ